MVLDQLLQHLDIAFLLSDMALVSLEVGVVLLRQSHILVKISFELLHLLLLLAEIFGHVVQLPCLLFSLG